MKIHFNKRVRIIFLILFLHITFLCSSQENELGIPFQGIAKDYSGNFVNQRIVYIVLSIISKDEPSNILMEELHKVKTDEWGLFSITIGKGKWLGGKHNQIQKIDWSTAKHQLHINIAVEPEAPLSNWDYTQHLISLGYSSFGVVPYALFSMNTVGFKDALNQKLNISDTSILVSNFIRKASIDTLFKSLQTKLNILDTASMLSNYQKRDTNFNKSKVDAQFSNKLNYGDSIKIYVTPFQIKNLSFDTSSIIKRIDLKLNANDTSSLSNRLDTKELLSNKSINIRDSANYSDRMYPSVKAAKDYIDSLYSIGILDSSITNSKIAYGISASKVGLGKLTNHPQIYSLNGLKDQVQIFSIPGNAGAAPNWVSNGGEHQLNIPNASVNNVTAGLISKIDYDHFVTAYTTGIKSITTSGTSGSAILSDQNLNIPNYTISGLSGNVNANTILAGPVSGVAGGVQFRSLVSSDIPNNASNTTGNSATATKLQNTRLINSVAFDGSSDILIKSSTTNKLNFSTSGNGANGTDYFDGSTVKTISYNTIGASPKSGSSDITTLGTITSGIWNGSVISESVGGAGSISGLLKADGTGLVSAASNQIDYQVPLSFTSPLSNNSNLISIQEANATNSGYINATDWSRFNNKINSSEKAAANGVATLNASGKIPTSQIPAISFSSGYVVSSASQMLALSSAVVGSIAIRTDNSKNYVLSANDPTVLSNWLELLMPAAVSSVNGYTTSSIVLTSTDINEGTNLYFTNDRAKSALNSFISGENPISYNTGTSKISITQSSSNSNGYLSSTDWNTFNNKLNSFSSQSANMVYASPNGNSGSPSFRSLVAADIPTLNQNTTGNAATASSLLNTRTINGVDFNGTADITISANTSNAIAFNNLGTGTISNTSFNGSAPVTISYNSIGAAPSSGSNNISTLGTITSGVWRGTVIESNYGGAGATNGILKSNGSGLVSAALAGTDFESPLSFAAPLSRSANSVSISSTPSFSSITSTGDMTAKRYKLTMPSATIGSSTTSIDLSTGNVFTINLSANISTLTITNAAVGTYLIKFVQDATGSRTVSFPGTWKWAGGIVPTLTTTASKLDIITLVYDGTNFYATIVKNF